MGMPSLNVVAEGTLPAGEHWTLRAGGTSAEYYTLLETAWPDGTRDEGGMGGPPLYPGDPVNVYTGRGDGGRYRVIVRADPRVRLVRVELDNGTAQDLTPVAEDAEAGVCFFAALLAAGTSAIALTASDAAGRVVAQRPARRPRRPPGW